MSDNVISMWLAALCCVGLLWIVLWTISGHLKRIADALEKKEEEQEEP